MLPIDPAYVTVLTGIISDKQGQLAADQDTVNGLNTEINTLTQTYQTAYQSLATSLQAARQQVSNDENQVHEAVGKLAAYCANPYPTPPG